MPPPDVAVLPEMVELVRVRVAIALLKMPPPNAAVLPESVQLVTVPVPAKKIPPPELVALLPEIVELETVPVPAKKIPPPLPLPPPAILPEMVELVMVRVPVLEMPLPRPTAVLSEMVELVTVRMPPLLKMPAPPPVEVLLLMVELVMVRVPKLLKAPPLPVIFAPETVTPEMERLPPEAMLKMLKLRLVLPPSKPLMVSEVEPCPVMVRVPAVVVEAMVGKDCNTLSKVIVPDTLKSIISLAMLALAVVMASLSEIPE